MLQTGRVPLESKAQKVRNSSPMEISEISGDEFPSFEVAIKAARLALAADFAGIIRSMIETGELVIKDGRIIPRD